MWDQRGQSRRWLLFTVWIGLAALCAFIDYSLQRTIALPIFLIASFGTVYFAFRNQRPSRFRFELLNHGSKGVRSALGFEVHLTHDGIKYREGITRYSSAPSEMSSRFRCLVALYLPMPNGPLRSRRRRFQKARRKKSSARLLPPLAIFKAPKYVGVELLIGAG